MSKEDAKPLDLIDAVDREILGFLAAASSDWGPLNVDDLSKYQGMALWMLVWSGLFELRLRVRAWSAVSTQVVAAECTVTGKYEGLLPEQLRATIPAFREGQVMCQAAPRFDYRLTVDGVQAQADAMGPTGMDRCLVLLATKRVIPGRVAIRITGLRLCGRA